LILVGVGLISAAASLLLLGQIQSPSQARNTSWYPAGIAVLGLGGFTFVLGVLVAGREWWEARSTPLLIEYDEEDSLCRQFGLLSQRKDDC